MKILLSLLFTFVALVLAAQDKIYKNTGDITSAKVIEINDDFIIFKMFSNVDGPNYKIRKDAVEKIVYQNGIVETYNTKTKQSGSTMQNGTAAPAFGGSAGFGPNIVSLDFLSILFLEIGMSYERILADGIIGLKIPVIIGMNGFSNNPVRQVSNKFQTGVDLNIYPTGQGSVRYFIGPAVRFGKVNVFDNYITSFNQNGTPNYGFGRVDYNLLAFQINNGVMFQPTNHFNVSLMLGIGLRKLSGKTSFTNYYSPNYGVFNANLAYRF